MVWLYSGCERLAVEQFISLSSFHYLAEASTEGEKTGHAKTRLSLRSLSTHPVKQSMCLWHVEIRQWPWPERQKLTVEMIKASRHEGGEQKLRDRRPGASLTADLFSRGALVRSSYGSDKNLTVQDDWGASISVVADCV